MEVQFISPFCNYKKSCKVNVSFSISLFNRILFKENIIAFYNGLGIKVEIQQKFYIKFV